jgi:plastocyanin
MRVFCLLPLAGSFALLAGCAGGASPAGTAPASTLPAAAGAAPMTIGFNDRGGFVDAKKSTLFTVGVRLVNEKPITDPTYGRIFGYFKGTKAKKSSVVTIPVGDTVVFDNVDTLEHHTADFLGDASAKGAKWPTDFNGSGTQSPAGTDISTAQFSTGTLETGQSSPVYTANVPGFYMFGCQYHYTSVGHRTIIIVH